MPRPKNTPAPAAPAKISIQISLIAGLAIALASSSFALPHSATEFGPKLPNLRETCTTNSTRSKLCLRLYLEYKCVSYGGFCTSAAKKMIDLLDLRQFLTEEIDRKNGRDSNERSGLYLKQIFFQKKMSKLFDERETGTRIDSLQNELEDSYRFETPGNLWDAVLASFYGDENAALDFATILLQDVSKGKWHLAYMEDSYSRALFSERSVQMGNLHAANELLNFLYENKLGDTGSSSRTDRMPQYGLYPSLCGLEKELHPFAHHFYIPAYLARKLVLEGVPTGEAHFVSFLLNAGYEFTKLDGKMRTHRWPLQDPKSFDPATFEMQMRKIYTGYVGALWGAGQISEAETYEHFSKEFGVDPHAKMQKLFNGSY